MASSLPWSDGRRWLAALTYDLRPLRGKTTDASLHAARKDAAIAILDGQTDHHESFQHRIFYNVNSISLTPSQWLPFDDAKPAADAMLAGQRVTRRADNLPFVLGDFGQPSQIAGCKPSITHGPFLDALDRKVYMNVFRPKSATSYSFPSIDGPSIDFLYVAAPITPTGRFTANFGAGTVWIRANIFTRSAGAGKMAPDDAFFGLAIASGQYTNAPNLTAPRTLALKLTQLGTTTGAKFSVKPVPNISFTFTWSNNQVTGTVTEIGSGELDVFGSHYKISLRNTRQLYYAGGRMNMNMESTSVRLKFNTEKSGLLELSGTVKLGFVAWSAQVVINPKRTFYEAVSGGGFALGALQGGHALVRGDQFPVSLEPFTLVAEPGYVKMLGTQCTLPTAVQTVNVIGDASRARNSVTYQAGRATAFVYTAFATGREDWTLRVDVSTALDKPRSVNNDRVLIRGQNNSDFPWATVSWSRTAAMTWLNVQAVNLAAVNDELEQVSFALKNLLVQVFWRATALDLTGQYTARNTLAETRLLTLSFLRHTIPFLPDPYATNFDILTPPTRKLPIGYLIIVQKIQGDKPLAPRLEIQLMTELAIQARTLPRNTGEILDDPAIQKVQQDADQIGLAGDFLSHELLDRVIPDYAPGYFFHLPNYAALEGREGSVRVQDSRPPTLLDLSSNCSQFGVVFGTGTPFSRYRGAEKFSRVDPFRAFRAVEDFRISNLFLESTLDNVRVMTLPAVQWEPVVEVTPRLAPGETYRFPYSGPSSQIVARTPPRKNGDVSETRPAVRLVPVAPLPALEGIVESFASEDPVAVAALSSLPFGLVGLAEVRNPGGTRTDNPPAKIRRIEFQIPSKEDPKTKLKSPDFSPAHQLSFTPPVPVPDFAIGPFLPHFGLGLLDGGISLREVLTSSSSPSFPGITRLLRLKVGPHLTDDDGNVLPDRAELTDPVAPQDFVDAFNDKVPLSRFDLSGYGASIFSDWRRVLGPNEEKGITQVLLNVLTGRTSREVVEFQTVMAPFAVKVVKVVDIRRLSSGVVVRRELDWQATSDGRYMYKNPAIVTHPGIILGVSAVRNIRDISGTIEDVATYRKVKFDCNVDILDGGERRTIHAVDLDGCVFLTSLNLGKHSQPITDDLMGQNGHKTYAAVLEKLNLGGAIDTVVTIGPSGQKKRVRSMRFKPSIDPTTNEPVAASAAMGAPIFPSGGQWSFAKASQTDDFNQTGPVDLSVGVPLVKFGRHDGPDLLTLDTPFQFKDAEDLLPITPQTMYSIVHGAASHRVLFQDPAIPFVQEAAEKGITAAKVFVADSIALGKSAAIFPNLQDCLPVTPILPSLDAPAPKQLLQILNEGAAYKFEPTRMLNEAATPFLEMAREEGGEIISDFERIVKEDSGYQTVAQVIKDGTRLKDGLDQLKSDITDAKSTLRLAINTLQDVSRIDITNMHMVTKQVDAAKTIYKDGTRVIGRIASDVKKIGGFLGIKDDLDFLDLPDGLGDIAQDVKHVFGSALDQVQKTLSFLENLKFLPNFKVSVTNEWAMTMSAGMTRQDLLDLVSSPAKETVERIVESFDLIISATVSLSAFLLKFHVGTTIKIPTGIGPIVALGTGAFDIAVGTNIKGGVEVLLELGLGIGVDFSVGPFSAGASYTQAQTILAKAGVFGLGITAIMRAHVDLVVASANLYLEAGLMVIGGSCGESTHEPHKDDGDTIYAWARVKIALHVSIFLVCNIGYEEEAHWDSNMNGGPCLLKDMSNLVT